MATARPWALNGKAGIGWRIDSMVPREGKTRLEFMLNPVAIVPDRGDAELIVRLANEDAAKEIMKTASG